MGATVQRFVFQPAAWDQTAPPLDQTGNCTANEAIDPSLMPLEPITPPSDQNQAPGHSNQQPADHGACESAMTTAQIAIAVCNQISAVHASTPAEADDPVAGVET